MLLSIINLFMTNWIFLSEVIKFIGFKKDLKNDKINLQIKIYKISLLRGIVFIYFRLNDRNALRYSLSDIKCNSNQKHKI